MKTAIVAIVLILTLAGTLYYAVDVWLSLEGVEMSVHGIIAIILCVIFVTGLGVGLMRLSYYSHHHGHDDRASGGFDTGDDEETKE